MSTQIEIESIEIGHTHSNLTSNGLEEDKSKISKKMKPISYRNRLLDELRQKEPVVSNQESNNFSIKTGQPLYFKSIDKQEGISQLDYMPSLNEIKRGETASDLGTNRIFIFNREEDKNHIVSHNSIIISSYLKKVNKQQFYSFLLSPIQNGMWLRCKIKKEKINNKVIFHCQLNDSEDLLMMITPNNANRYIVYTNLNYNSDKLLQIGKIKKNFLGTQFSLATTVEEFQSPKIYINYSLNVLGMAGPMGMKVNIPSNSPLNKKPLQLKNKAPVYSERYKCYVLDYVDRKNVQCSTKNFQLISIEEAKPTNSYGNDSDSGSEEKNKIVLQFGVIKDNCYLLDFKHPLSPIQAFAISISNLHNKLMCE